MPRLSGNIFLIGGGVFILVMTINDTAAFTDDTSIINLALRALLSSVIFAVLICIGAKLINFGYNIEPFQPNFIEDLVWTSETSSIIGTCLGWSVALHIFFPILAIVFDTASGIFEFIERFS